MTAEPNLTREGILQKVRERIFTYAASRVGGTDAEDLAQDTLMLIEKKYSDKQDLQDLIPLAVRTIQFKIRAHRRRKAVRFEDDLDGLWLPDGSLNPEELAAFAKLREQVESAMDKLGDRCRQIFLMKIEGLGFPEIMRRMGQTKINTIYTWDKRCRDKMSELMAGMRKGR